MGQLSGHEILRRIHAGDIVISPFDPAMVGPNSVDLHVQPRFLRLCGNPSMDAKPETQEVLPDADGRMWLEPGELYLGTTVEYTATPLDLVPHLHGRSSLGRLGVSVHVTAGRGDRGFRGAWVLEIAVVRKTRVRFDRPWCQLEFHAVVGDTAGGYVGRYQDQQGIVPSRIAAVSRP